MASFLCADIHTSVHLSANRCSTVCLRSGAKGLTCLTRRMTLRYGCSATARWHSSNTITLMRSGVIKFFDMASTRICGDMTSICKKKSPTDEQTLPRGFERQLVGRFAASPGPNYSRCKPRAPVPRLHRSSNPRLWHRQKPGLSPRAA